MNFINNTFKRGIIYRDEAGNTLLIESDGRLAVRNREGKIVTRSEFNKFINRPKARTELKRFYRVGTRVFFHPTKKVKGEWKRIKEKPRIIQF